jgi:hypothetical protein
MEIRQIPLRFCVAGFGFPFDLDGRTAITLPHLLAKGKQLKTFERLYRKTDSSNLRLKRLSFSFRKLLIIEQTGGLSARCPGHSDQSNADENDSLHERLSSADATAAYHQKFLSGMESVRV